MCTPECTWHSTKGTCRAPFCTLHRCSCVLLHFRTSSIGPEVIFSCRYRLIFARFHGLLVSACSRSTNSPQLKYLFIWSLVLSVFVKPGQQFCFMFYQFQHPDGIASHFVHKYICGLDRHHVQLWDLQGVQSFGGEPSQAKLLAHLCSALEVSEGKTDALECSRQCHIFNTKN